MSNTGVIIKQVWRHNFVAEMSIIKEKAIISHPFLSLTTRLSQCQQRVPVGSAWGSSDANYLALLHTTNCFPNVVQVGLALCDKVGNLPRCSETGRPCAWEFNLMPLEEAAIDPENEELFLKQCCSSINAQQLRGQGIHPVALATALLSCSLLMGDRISWVVFKGGLDFMTVLRFGLHDGVMLMPPERMEFLELVDRYFPSFYDMAAVIGFLPEFDDGTIVVSALSINVWREDLPPFGAASDSLLALGMLTRMKPVLKDRALLEKKKGVLFGITSEQVASAVDTYDMIRSSS